MSKMGNLLSSSVSYEFETLKVTRPREHIVQVELNRPEKENAMNRVFWRELGVCFNQIAEDDDCRAIVLSGAGKVFTSGLDLLDLHPQLDGDIGRVGLGVRKTVRSYQKSITAVEKCPKPVIAAVHNACVGGGIDLITTCDIRYCTSDAWFYMKEIDIGLAADAGTLQRLPKIIGNDSIAREIAYTGRKLFANEAKEIGLIGRIFDTKESMIDGALETASIIASKSPVGVLVTKTNLVYSRDHSVQDGLDYLATWNQNMLQSEDVRIAINAVLENKKPEFKNI